MLRTFIYFSILWIPVIFLSPIALIYIILMKLRIGGWMEGFIHWGVSGWSKLLFKSSGSTFTVEGLDNIPDEKGLCYVSNHQSAVDILVVLATLPETVGFVAKKQLIHYPFLNLWILAIKSVFIDRGNVRKAVQSIENGVESLRRGNSMIIFPEGTRSKSDTLGPFKGGSIKLATKAEATIVPLTISGSWHIWEEKHSISPADIRFTVHPPIPTKGLSAEERKTLPDRIAAQIGTALPG
jgi:1-acyl-sn-glycerol-3-phosphate acyltransferase